MTMIIIVMRFLTAFVTYTHDFKMSEMTVYLKIEGDGITIYEDVTYKEGLLEYVNRILREVFENVNDVEVSLEIVYEYVGLKVRLL